MNILIGFAQVVVIVIIVAAPVVNPHARRGARALKNVWTDTVE